MGYCGYLVLSITMLFVSISYIFVSTSTITKTSTTAIIKTGFTIAMLSIETSWPFTIPLLKSLIIMDTANSNGGSGV